MRLMVFSDIHGNLPALERVLSHAADRNVHRYICLGDIVGYGPFPNECVERIRHLKNCRCVVGNHDVAALWETSPYGMNASAKKAILWTMDRLTPESRDFLSGLPDRLDLFDMTFVHADPYSPRGWGYVLDRKHALRSFAASRFRNIFIGHSHRPLVITRNGLFRVALHTVSGTTEFPVSDSRRRIINCGSIGQPRDKDPRACYLIYDSRRQRLEYHRVAYDTEQSAQAIYSAGLPERLGKRLLKGI